MSREIWGFQGNKIEINRFKHLPAPPWILLPQIPSSSNPHDTSTYVYVSQVVEDEEHPYTNHNLWKKNMEN